MGFDPSKAEVYMRRCFALAEMGKGGVKTNPVVGAILVYNDKIIGEGYHRKFGKEHAEINALHSVKEKDKGLLADSDMYLSLEPCTHIGKTAPCTEALINNKIKRVFISCRDPNPDINGKGIEKLKNAGIEVFSGILKDQGESLIERFRINISQKRPYIILKYAQSPDGYMGKKDESVWLSNKYSKFLVHKWRSEADGILIGANTAVLDNPILDVRFGFEGTLTRILLDQHLSCSRDLLFFKEKSPAIVVTEMKSALPANVKVFISSFDENLLTKLLKYLYQQNIGVLIVEGGGRTIRKFVKENYWDEARIFRTSMKLDSGIKAPNLGGKLIRTSKLVNDELIYIKRT